MSEEVLKSAFVCMYNRFRLHQKELLDTTVSLLTEARTKILSQKKEISQIDTEIAKLSTQSEMFHKLHASCSCVLRLPNAPSRGGLT